MNKIAIAWYNPEDWERLREISDDSDELEETYEEWIFQAEKAFMDLRSAGMDATKIYIDLDELLGWCKEKNLKIDAGSRSNFTSFKLQELYTEK